KSSSGTVNGLPPLSTRPTAFTFLSPPHPPTRHRVSPRTAASSLFTTISGRYGLGAGELRQRRRSFLRTPGSGAGRGSEFAADAVAVGRGQRVPPGPLVAAVLDEPHAAVGQADVPPAGVQAPRLAGGHQGVAVAAHAVHRALGRVGILRRAELEFVAELVLA